MHAFTYTLSTLLVIIVPIIFALILRRYFRVSWFLFGIGTVTFIGSQVVHLPLNNLLSKIGLLPESGMQPESILPVAIILGLTAGLCEELARAVSYWLLKGARKFEDGMMLGLGHGGIEAMIMLGILNAGTLQQLFALRGADLQSMGLSAEQITFIGQQMDLFNRSSLLAFASFAERLLAMSMHVILSLIVLAGFQNRKWLGIGAAILYHALVDALAVFTAYRTSNALIIEGVLAASLIPGLIWVVWYYRKQLAGRELRVLPVEWGLFFQEIRKEFMQLWRSKMVLVIIGVFVLFGIASPLLAYFMPQIFGSIEGAEMFKDLIPQPTITDSMTQYIKNISQFGFLIAILVGMGKIAGEKERGLTEMILHKPLPRWAYVVAKFVAQAVVYTAAFLFSGAFAYGYSVYLFGAFSFSAFAILNSLLLVWLLCFVAITVLASTLTRSTGTAAGVALGGAVVMLLSAQIPKYGILSPQALMNWVSAIGAQQAASLQTANFAALGFALVLIIMCMVWAVGALEQQEIS